MVAWSQLSVTDRTKLLWIVEECFSVVCFCIPRFHEEELRYAFHTVACIHFPHPHYLTKRVSPSSPCQPARPVLQRHDLPHVSPANGVCMRTSRLTSLSAQIPNARDCQRVCGRDGSGGQEKDLTRSSGFQSNAHWRHDAKGQAALRGNFAVIDASKGMHTHGQIGCQGLSPPRFRPQ